MATEAFPPSAPCDMPDGCGAPAGEICEPGCPSLTRDPDELWACDGCPTTGTEDLDMARAELRGLVGDRVDGMRPPGHIRAGRGVMPGLAVVPDTATVPVPDVGAALTAVTTTLAALGITDRLQQISAAPAREFQPPHPLAGTVRVDVTFTWPAHGPATALRDALRARPDTAQAFTAGRRATCYLHTERTGS
ncbi:MAG: hypothetical protein L0I76_16225 [Pseudonocardia sp.]|nr:hypothetical protein [Pseudonocardia sp.]